MKVIDFIKVCRGNVKFRFDTDPTFIDRQNALKVCWDKGLLDREVAAVTFDAFAGDGGGASYTSSTTNVVPLPLEGKATIGVVCEISTVYEEKE